MIAGLINLVGLVMIAVAIKRAFGTDALMVFIGVILLCVAHVLTLDLSVK